MLIVDSSVWIDLLCGRKTPQTILLEREAGLQQVGLADLSLYEVLQGVRPEDFAIERDRLLEFHVLSTGGAEMALQAARFSSELRQKGIRPKTVDCLIATLCISQNHILLTSDADFAPYAKHLGLMLL